MQTTGLAGDAAPPARCPRGGPWGRRSAWVIALLGLGGSVGLSACKDLTGSQPLPSGTVNPAFYNTPAGALGLQAKAIYALEQALPLYITSTGLLTDELQSVNIGMNPVAALDVSVSDLNFIGDALDARILPSAGGYGDVTNAEAATDYTNLQRVRADLGQALAAIAAYDTGAKAVGDPKHLRAELFALEGYTEIVLADYFCSGVPLSTLDFHGDFTYHAGSPTDAVYQDAIVQEDSALALGDTSLQVQYLARVLKGRALLARNDAAGAAQVVASVPDGFQYQLAVNFHANSNNSLDNQLNGGVGGGRGGTIADTEGHNGLPYLSGGDPRSAAVVLFPAHTTFTTGEGSPPTGPGNAVPLTFPSKYSPSGFSPFVVASGVEARLIEAEAALKAGSSSWLTALNTLRTNGVALPPDTLFDTLGVTDCGTNGYGLCGTSAQQLTIAGGQPPGGFPTPAGYSLAGADTVSPAPAGIQGYCNNNSWYEPCYNGDTMVVLLYVRSQGWATGTGGVANLAPLSDPGTDSARVALVFRERAFWLFLTGHRQGDLRRLLRQYSQWFRTSDQVYPTGRFTGAGTQTYGTDVTAPIPGDEYLNPLFHGCLDRNP